MLIIMARKYLNLSNILKKILFEKDMRPADLARELNMPVPTIHRIVTGKSTRPYQSSLEAIAEYLNVSVEQLTGDEPLLPSTLDDVKSLPIGKYTKVVPLISWSTLDDRNRKVDSEVVVINVSDKAFALVMPDYSMEPLIQNGSTLIFDPEAEPMDRSYVLVKLAEHSIYLCRQLLMDCDKKFVKALNPDISVSSIRQLTDEDQIIARLVETRNKL